MSGDILKIELEQSLPRNCLTHLCLTEVKIFRLGKMAYFLKPVAWEASWRMDIVIRLMVVDSLKSKNTPEELSLLTPAPENPSFFPSTHVTAHHPFPNKTPLLSPYRWDTCWVSTGICDPKYMLVCFLLWFFIFRLTADSWVQIRDQEI